MYAPGEQCSQDQNDHCGVGHNWNEPIKDPELANCKRHGIVLMHRHRPVQQQRVRGRLACSFVPQAPPARQLA